MAPNTNTTIYSCNQIQASIKISTVLFTENYFENATKFLFYSTTSCCVMLGLRIPIIHTDVSARYGKALKICQFQAR